VRKIILQMQMTFDGYVSGLNGELDWIDFDSEMGKNHYDLAKNASLSIMGRTVYDQMVGYWPQAAANPDGDLQEVEYAELINRIPKLVITTKEEQLTWENTETCVIKDDADLLNQMNELKQLPGEYMVVNGGIQTAQTFIELGLIDEFRLDVCPVTLGQGKALFTKRLQLDLIDDVKRYDSGALGLTYRPKNT
jgi:dihydrofolate reductase